MAYLDYLLKQALGYLNKENYDKSIEIFTKILSVDGTHFEALSARSSALRRQGRFSAALKDIERCIAQMPLNADCYFQRATLFVALGNTDSAIMDLTRAIELDGSLHQAFEIRSQLHTDPKHAIQDLSVAIELAPDNAAYLYSRAKVSHALGVDDSALTDLQGAVVLAPHYSEAFSLLAEISDAQGDLTAALAAARQVVRLRENDLDAKEKLSRLQKQLSQKDIAQESKTITASRFHPLTDVPVRQTPGVLLREGASGSQLDQLEESLEFELPSEFRTLWLLHDGEEINSSGALNGFRLLSCAEIERFYDDWMDRYTEELSDVYRSRPAGRVQRKRYDSLWVPVAERHGDHFLAVDLNPAHGGVFGQVITFSQQCIERSVVADRISELIAWFCRERGDKHTTEFSSLRPGIDYLEEFRANQPDGYSFMLAPKNDSVVVSSQSMANLWQSFDYWVKKTCPGLIGSFLPGASSFAISSLEQALRVTLPQDFKELWRIRDGQETDPDIGALCGLPLLNLNQIENEWTMWSEVANEDMTVLDLDRYWSVPEGHVRRQYINLKWIPISKDYSGNHIGIDLDPGEGGTVGQVINFGKNEHTKYVMATSLAQFLEILTDQLARGNFHINSSGEFAFKSLTGIPGFEHMIYLTGSGSMRDSTLGRRGVYSIEP